MDADERADGRAGHARAHGAPYPGAAGVITGGRSLVAGGRGGEGRALLELAPGPNGGGGAAAGALLIVLRLTTPQLLRFWPSEIPY